MPRVFVSGCFDLLHAGHLEFLTQAARLGTLSVAVGSDRTIRELKGRAPIYTETERLALVQALRCVEDAWISSGSGVLDFESELRNRRPEVFVVNDDGHSEAKQSLCAELGIRYVVLPRMPARGMPERSSSEVRRLKSVPYRIELTGGWLDQPEYSQHVAGEMIVASIEPSFPAERGSGLASSTHATAQRLWGDVFPRIPPLDIAHMLFACENPPGKTPIAGSQDALGIALPGIHRLEYAGHYWPRTIAKVGDDDAYDWLEQRICLIHTGRRDEQYEPHRCDTFDLLGPTMLAESSRIFTQALSARDLAGIGQAFQLSLQGQQRLFCNLLNEQAAEFLRVNRPIVYGAKFTGAGGGGYMIVAAEVFPPQALPIRIRRTATYEL